MVETQLWKSPENSGQLPPLNKIATPSSPKGLLGVPISPNSTSNGNNQAPAPAKTQRWQRKSPGSEP